MNRVTRETGVRRDAPAPEVGEVTPPGRQPYTRVGGHGTSNITQGDLGPLLAVIPRPVLAGSSSANPDLANENRVLDHSAAVEPLVLEMLTNRDLFEMREGNVIPFLRIMSTEADQHQLGTITDGRLFRAMGAHLFLAVAQFMNIHDRFAYLCDQLDNLNAGELRSKLRETKKELKEREKELAAKDEEVIKAMEVGSAAKAASAKKDRRIAELEVQLASSEAEIARLSNELGRAGQNYEQTILSQSSRLGSRKDDCLKKVCEELIPSLRQTYRFGVVNFKTQVFLNSVGQRFLETLHKEMIEKYRHTPQYLADLESPMSFFMDEAVKIAMELMRCSAEQKAKYYFKDMFARFDRSKAAAKLDIDPTLRTTSTWWIPIMDKAVKEFVEANVKVENTLTELIYHLPYFKKLSPAYVDKL